MISRIRLPPKTTSLVSVLTFLAMPSHAFSQPDREIAARDTLREAEEAIQEIEQRDGLSSANLIEALTSLGLLYEAEGDYGSAVAAFEQARGIVRANYGFQSMDEAQLIQQMVRAEEARGNVSVAWDLEQDLLDLIGPSPTDLRTVALLREIADKRADVMERFSAGEFPPQIALGCYYHPESDGDCDSGSRRQVIGLLSYQAQLYRAMAIEAILKNEDYASDQLRELEMEAVRHAEIERQYACPPMPLNELLGTELLGDCLEPVIGEEDPAFSHVPFRPGRRITPIANVGGASSLVRLYLYEIRSGGSDLSQANALVQLADYYLALSRTRDSASSILPLYERAYLWLEQSSMDQASIQEMFSPTVPVVIPTHLSNPLVSEETPGSTGYIDIAFDVTRYGRSDDIEVLEATSNATSAVTRDIVSLIEHSRFRPQVTDGEVADTARTIVRYFFTEQI